MKVLIVFYVPKNESITAERGLPGTPCKGSLQPPVQSLVITTLLKFQFTINEPPRSTTVALKLPPLISLA